MKQNYTIFWVIGIFFLVILILPQIKLPQTSDEPLSISVEYFQNGVKVSSLFSAFIVYNQVRFHVYASNTGGTELTNLQVVSGVNTFPQVFEDNLPIRSYETLQVGETNKLILSTDLIDVDHFLLMIQPVTFSVEVSADGAVENQVTSFDLTFQQPFSELEPYDIQGYVVLGGIGYNNWGEFVNIIDYSGSGYFTGMFATLEDFPFECVFFIDNIEFFRRESAKVQADPIVDMEHINLDSIVRFENSLKIQCRVYDTYGNERMGYTLSYMIDPGICFPETPEETCGNSVCGIIVNNCGEEINCGTCSEGSFCSNGLCVEEIISDFPLAGIISYWKFDEISGTTIDSHGTNNGIIIGVTQGVASEILGTAYSFNGEGYINFGDILDITDAITVSMWIKPSMIDGKYHMMTSKYDPGVSDTINLIIDSSNKIRWSGTYNDGWRDVFSNNVVSAGNWYHLVGTFDGSSTKLYVNGILQSDEHFGTTTIKTNDANFNIGRRSSGDLYYKGLIDEVGIWNRALTQEEITELNNKVPYPS